MAKRPTEAEKFVRAWCLEAEMLVEDLTPVVKKLMNTYTWYLQCIPGCGTRKAKISTSFNIWNWRKAAIRFQEDPEQFNRLLILTVHTCGGFMTPGMMSNEDRWRSLDREWKEYGRQEYDRVIKHCVRLARDHELRVDFDAWDYPSTNCLIHLVGVSLLHHTYNVDCGSVVKSLRTDVQINIRLLFTQAVLIQDYAQNYKGDHALREHTHRVINEVLSNALPDGPAGLNQATSSRV